MYKEKEIIPKVFIHWGLLTQAFHFGIQFDRYGWDINLAFFYVGMTW
jgi:hypothetical protein